MSDAVALAAVPWAGVLVLTSLPYYFLQVLFLDRLAEVGNAAAHYGRALGALANWTIAAFVVSLWGRAVWAARARRRDARRLVARSRVAWTNYWELRCEAEVLLRARPPADGRARPP